MNKKQHANKGKKHTLEHTLKIANANRGRKNTEESKKRMSDAHIGKKHTEEQKLKISESLKRIGHKPIAMTGEMHHMWKGNAVGYHALHDWVRLHKGSPKECEHCGTTNASKYVWANRSREYIRDLGDWIRLCTSCHIKYDKDIRQKRFNLKDN